MTGFATRRNSLILDNRLLIINTKYTNLFENLPFVIVMVVLKIRIIALDDMTGFIAIIKREDS